MRRTQQISAWWNPCCVGGDDTDTYQPTDRQSMKTYGNVEMDMEHERNGWYVDRSVTTAGTANANISNGQ